MSITPADLAVGQVWRDKDLDAWTVDWLDLPTGRAAWTVVYADGSSDGVNAGAARTLAGFMTRNLAKLERPAPSPVPHPAALADLYEACKAAAEHVAELREAWQRGCIGEHDGLGGTRSNRNVDVDVMLRAALAKAGAK